MKDYTGYDFAAIKDAHVEFQTVGEECDCLYKRGKVFSWDKDYIHIQDDTGFISPYCIRDIIPDSLKATIKVEDMSVEQFVRMMDRRSFISMKFDEYGIWLECSTNKVQAVIRFGKCIDITDLGWSKAKETKE